MEKANEWSQIIFALNCIDVLRSFAITANFACMPMSRPVIVRTNSSGFNQRSTGPTLHMKGLWHPYALGESGGTPVPNDLCLGDHEFGYSPRTLLLTGPNMGGKSTLLRATCLAVILAQVNFYAHNGNRLQYRRQHWLLVKKTILCTYQVRLTILCICLLIVIQSNMSTKIILFSIIIYFSIK